MKNEKEFFDLIERYLKGKLSPSDLLDFEKRYESDSSFAEEVEAHKKAHVTLAYGVESRLKKRLDSMGQEMLKEEVHGNKGKVIPIFRYASIAAAVAALVICGYLAYQQFYPKTDYKELYSMYFEKPDVATRNLSSDSLMLIGKGFQAYENGNYELALSLWDESAKMGLFDTLSIEDLSMLSFYRGVSQLEIDSLNLANISFVHVSEFSLYYERADWYSVLICIKSKDKEAALRILDNILQKPSHGYHAKAAKLKQELVE